MCNFLPQKEWNHRHSGRCCKKTAIFSSSYLFISHTVQGIYDSGLITIKWKIAICCLHIMCFFSPSWSPEKNINLEQQLTPERSEGVSSCSNLIFFEGLQDGRKNTCICKQHNIYRFLVLILILSFSRPRIRKVFFALGPKLRYQKN